MKLLHIAVQRSCLNRLNVNASFAFVPCTKAQAASAAFADAMLLDAPSPVKCCLSKLPVAVDTVGRVQMQS